MKKFLVGLVATLSVFTFAPRAADAATYNLAYTQASRYALQDCPHHFSGRCADSGARFTLTGIGAGRWAVYEQGWECAAWNLSHCTHTTATWYYWRNYTIANDGQRVNVGGYGNDG